MTPLRLSAEQRHFFNLTVGIWCAVLVGVTYAFGIFSNRMKTEFGLNQEDITTISTVGMSFSFFCFPAGVVFDKWGPHVVNTIATTLMALGFVGNGLIFLKVIPGTTVSLSVCAMLTFSTAGWFDVGTLMTNLFNFPYNRGQIVILQKTFMGLGSAVFSVAYSAFFAGNYAGYSFFVAAVVTILGAIGALVIRLPSEAAVKGEIPGLDLQHLDGRRFVLGTVLLVCNMILLLSVCVATALVDISSSGHVALGVVAMLLVASFIFVTVLPQRDDAGLRRNLLAAENGDAPGPSPLQVPQSAQPAVNEYEAALELLPSSTFLQSLRTVRLWLLWFISFSVWGANVVIVLNLSQIYRAANENRYDDRTNAMYVALTGISSALGRVSVGVAEQVIRKRLGVTHITCLLPLPGLLTIVSTSGFLYMPASGIVFPFVTSTFAYGMSWAVTVLMMKVMYPTDVGKHYNFLFSGGLAALLIFNRGMFGTLFVREGQRQGLDHECAGRVCYSATFQALTGLNCVAFLVACLVVFGWLRQVSQLRDKLRAAGTAQPSSASLAEYGGKGGSS